MNALLRKLFLFLSAMALMSWSYTNTTMPQPEDFGRTFVAALKQDDSLAFVNAFRVTNEQLVWWKDQIEKEEHRHQEDAIFLMGFLRDSAVREVFVRKIELEAARNYSKLKAWRKREEVDLGKLEFIRIYFELRFDQEYNVYYLRRSTLMVKCKDRYFAFFFSDCFYLKDRWMLADVDQIEERDQYLNELEQEEIYAQDSIAIAPADSARMVLSKKQIKIQKKMDKEQRKIDELYQKLYQ